jgi:hypothetical protein
MQEKSLGADAAAVDGSMATSADTVAPHAERITVIELDPKVWNAGMRYGESALLYTDEGRRAQCCIGIACSVLGLADDDLKSIHYAHYLGDPEALPEPLRPIARLSTHETTVYEINDDMDKYDNDAERVAAINAELRRIGAPLSFALKIGSGNQDANAERLDATHRSEAHD